MKNPHYEKLGIRMRDYHRTHSWRLDQGGLYIPHHFEHMEKDSLSWWDDVGFVLNRRRIIVYWQHPRAMYSQAMTDQAEDAAGERPARVRLKFGASKNYHFVGQSERRKKLVSYTAAPRTQEQRTYDERLQDIERRLISEGINISVPASWKWKRLPWAMSVNLVTPVEVRTRDDLTLVANMARRLMTGQTTLQTEFPKFSYDKSDWLLDQAVISKRCRPISYS